MLVISYSSTADGATVTLTELILESSSNCTIDVQRSDLLLQTAHLPLSEVLWMFDSKETNRKSAGQLTAKIIIWSVS